MEEVTTQARDPRARPVQAWLRERTGDAHRSAERAVMRALEPLSRASYGAYLLRVHRLFAALEPSLWAACAPLVPDAASRAKRPWLDEDLAALGLCALPEASPLAWGSPLEALGAAYVIEGSTLGGPVLLERLHAAGAVDRAGEGARFLRGYGAETAARWHAFRNALHAGGARDREPVLAGAQAMFRAYEAAIHEAGAR